MSRARRASTMYFETCTGSCFSPYLNYSASYHTTLLAYYICCRNILTISQNRTQTHAHTHTQTRTHNHTHNLSHKLLTITYRCSSVFARKLLFRPMQLRVSVANIISFKTRRVKDWWLAWLSRATLYVSEVANVAEVGVCRNCRIRCFE